MLTNAPVHPTLPVVGLERAKKFYEEKKLGLKVIGTDPSPGAVLQAGVVVALVGYIIYINTRIDQIMFMLMKMEVCCN